MDGRWPVCFAKDNVNIYLKKKKIKYNRGNIYFSANALNFRFPYAYLSDGKCSGQSMMKQCVDNERTDGEDKRMALRSAFNNKKGVKGAYEDRLEKLTNETGRFSEKKRTRDRVGHTVIADDV